jgi:hypothetical protein
MKGPAAMREVWIRRRADGVTELSPTIAPLEIGDRWLIIVTVFIAAAGFFIAGAMPAAVLGALVAACIVGEVVLGAKAVVLVLLRPPAQVHEVPRFVARRR